MTGEAAMPGDSTQALCPNDRLADEVADALVDAGLIQGTHEHALREKLKAGGVKQEDWNLWVDVATFPVPEQEGEDASG